MIRSALTLPAFGFGLALLAAPPAAAHPHIFVNVSHTLLFDAQGRLTGLRARWDYDEMFTLLMVEDGKYDTNGDGQVDGDELKRFQRWDADWPADYSGDVEITLDGKAVALQGPSDWAAQWRDGRAVSIHTRQLVTPLAITGKTLSIRPYDKDFYVDYEVTDPPHFDGRTDCHAEVIAPGPNPVSPQVAEAIANLPAETTPEAAGLPSVGRLYSDEEKVQCGR